MDRLYGVMLIDDEVSVRRLLRASIDWNSLGMEVVGEAGSGIEAINTIDEIRPDIAFVDITMPFMDGIELTDIITKRYPNLIVIILTASNDFENARQCIRLPVFEYMLKPIVRTEVTEILGKVKAKLDSTAPASHEPVVDVEPTTIEQIEKYLRENYTDSQINLTSVSQMFGFSSSYLSRKFKQVTGKSFVEYLTECRMERAMELATPNSKMFRTAIDVGIPDPNYFGRCFKKYTGMSYSDYAASK